MSPTFFSDIFLRHLHRHYRHYCRHITAKTIFAPTFCTDILHRHFTPTKQHQPSAFTDQLQIDYFRKIIPKGIRTEEKGITQLYKGILRKNGGDYIIEYQQLKSFIVQVVAFSLCKLRLFHCASCGYFIMQVEDFS